VNLLTCYFMATDVVAIIVGRLGMTPHKVK